MAWRVANSLQVLLGQFNTLAPTRNKVSDGSIGDTDHQNRTSDHNPWYPKPNGGIVTARDFTHDPAKLSMHWVANTLVAHRDPRIKYIIWDERILSGNPGPNPWVWRPYSGSNPHTHHLHLSVVDTPACDSTAAWAGFISQAPPPPEVPDMQLTDKIRRDWDGKEITVATAFLETWQNAMDTILELRKMNGVVLTIAARTANNPDITREEIAQIVRDNTPEPVPADVDEVAIAALIVQEIGTRTDVAPETVQEIAQASAAAVAARMAN